MRLMVLDLILGHARAYSMEQASRPSSPEETADKGPGRYSSISIKQLSCELPHSGSKYQKMDSKDSLSWKYVKIVIRSYILSNVLCIDPRLSVFQDWDGSVRIGAFLFTESAH